MAVNAHIPLTRLLLAQTELRENGQNVVVNNLKFYKLFWFVSYFNFSLPFSFSF